MWVFIKIASNDILLGECVEYTVIITLDGRRNRIVRGSTMVASQLFSGTYTMKCFLLFPCRRRWIFFFFPLVVFSSNVYCMVAVVGARVHIKINGNRCSSCVWVCSHGWGMPWFDWRKHENPLTNGTAYSQIYIYIPVDLHGTAQKLTTK